MRQVKLYTAASLDNYIATPEGGVDWLNRPEFVQPDEDYGYGEFYKSIDTTLMGHNTYRFILDQDVPFPYPDKKNYVCSRSSQNRDTEFVQFIKGDIVGFVRQLKVASGADIWLVGGGQINALLLQNGLIDEMILTLFPLALGEGIPLFHGKHKAVNFDLKSSRSYESGILQLTFQVQDTRTGKA
jgi:dihydrofolate reductase